MGHKKHILNLVEVHLTSTIHLYRNEESQISVSEIDQT